MTCLASGCLPGSLLLDGSWGLQEDRWFWRPRTVEQGLGEAVAGGWGLELDRLVTLIDAGLTRSTVVTVAAVLWTLLVLWWWRRRLRREQRLSAEAQTHRSLAAESIRQQQLLTTILETIPYFVFWKDRQSRYLGCNANFARVAGLSYPSQIVGLTDHNLAWTPGEADWYRQCDEKIMSSGQAQNDIEEPQRQADGSERVIITSKVPLRNAGNEVIGIIGIFTDITHIRKAEQQLKLQAAALESSADGVTISDRDGTILWANPAMSRISRHPLETIIGANHRLFKSGRHDAAFYKDMYDTIDAGKVWRGHVVNRRGDGSLYHENAAISPVTDAQGQITHYVAVKRDVTQEHELRSQLDTARKLEAIGQLAAGIAHEINTPTQYVGDNLRFLQGCTRQILDTLGAVRAQSAHVPDPEPDRAARVEAALAALDLDYLLEEIPKALTQSLEGVVHVSEIVKALKEFAHPDGGLKQPMDLNHAVQQTATMCRNRWKYVARMNLELADDLPTVDACPSEINQVILNLMVNAADAIAEAQKTDPDRAGLITVRTARSGEFVEVRVRDNGVGIRHEVAAKLFEPFFTTKEVGAGSGQGLAICRVVVVNKHGGAIDFETAPGQGACFFFRLPVRTREPISSGAAA